MITKWLYKLFFVLYNIYNSDNPKAIQDKFERNINRSTVYNEWLVYWNHKVIEFIILTNS